MKTYAFNFRWFLSENTTPVAPFSLEGQPRLRTNEFPRPPRGGPVAKSSVTMTSAVRRGGVDEHRGVGVLRAARSRWSLSSERCELFYTGELKPGLGFQIFFAGFKGVMNIQKNPLVWWKNHKIWSKNFDSAKRLFLEFWFSRRKMTAKKATTWSLEVRRVQSCNEKIHLKMHGRHLFQTTFQDLNWTSTDSHTDQLRRFGKK